MLVGRQAERAALAAVLRGARSGRGGALVLRGEAGVGKSALLEHARAAADGCEVLHAVGIESEAELAFAGLHQLLHPVLDRTPSLPAPQAAAMRAAFGLSDETVAERFRISLAALGLLAAAAEERPVLCIVDDAQWLDEASAAALLFAARRLEAEHVAILFAARDDAQHPFEAAGIPDVRVWPLAERAARELVVGRLGEQAATEAVDWVVAHAAGNPLALIELPTALSAEQMTGRAPLGDVLPPATSVEQTYLDRIARLPSAVQEWLLVVAAEQTGDRATIGRAGELLGLHSQELAAAEASRLVQVTPDRVVFGHPLMRSAVYRGAPFTQREAAHRALADVLSNPADADRRAWHRAAAASGPDDDVADELEETASRARQRAGYSGAATALERAASLSSDGSTRARRLVQAARAAWQAGRPERVRTLLTLAEPYIDDVALRAERDHLHGLVELGCGALLDAGAILIEGADAVAAHEPRKALEMLLDAGSVAGRSGNFARMAEAGQRAAALVATDDEKAAVLSDLLVGVGGLIEGRTADEVPRIVSALARADRYDDPRVLSWAAVGAATIGDEAGEARLLARAASVARASGSVDTLVLILETSTSSAHVAGRYSIAGEAEEGLRLAGEVGLTNPATAFRGMLCWVAALAGQDETCLSYAAEVEAVAENGMANSTSIAQWAVALLDLSRGRPEQTITRLTALRAAPPGAVHPFFVLMSTPELVEALLQTGRAGEAAEAFEPLAGFARPGAPIWALGYAARCRAMLAEGDAAHRCFIEALELYATVNRPFDTARTQLSFGGFLRRQRRRGDAREHLRQAVDTFERLGAEPWAERAHVELRATGETARKRDPSTVSQLTPQETQIARLVGEGLSNKDVAAQLFLSPRTVEYHLAKVFAKLDITSRAELIRRRASLEPVG
jgi:DNA-binding CsgD family transcriptional regulator